MSHYFLLFFIIVHFHWYVSHIFVSFKVCNVSQGVFSSSYKDNSQVQFTAICYWALWRLWWHQRNQSFSLGPIIHFNIPFTSFKSYFLPSRVWLLLMFTVAILHPFYQDPFQQMKQPERLIFVCFDLVVEPRHISSLIRATGWCHDSLSWAIQTSSCNQPLKLWAQTTALLSRAQCETWSLWFSVADFLPCECQTESTQIEVA